MQEIEVMLMNLDFILDSMMSQRNDRMYIEIGCSGSCMMTVFEGKVKW